MTTAGGTYLGRTMRTWASNLPAPYHSREDSNNGVEGHTVGTFGDVVGGVEYYTYVTTGTTTVKSGSDLWYVGGQMENKYFPCFLNSNNCLLPIASTEPDMFPERIPNWTGGEFHVVLANVTFSWAFPTDCAATTSDPPIPC